MRQNLIYYNAFFLFQLMEIKETAGLVEEADEIKRISPIGWRHVNLYGKYEFKKDGMVMSANEILKNLERSYKFGNQMEFDFNKDNN